MFVLDLYLTWMIVALTLEWENNVLKFKTFQDKIFDLSLFAISFGFVAKDRREHCPKWLQFNILYIVTSTNHIPFYANVSQINFSQQDIITTFNPFQNNQF